MPPRSLLLALPLLCACLAACDFGGGDNARAPVQKDDVRPAAPAPDAKAPTPEPARIRPSEQTPPRPTPSPTPTPTPAPAPAPEAPPEPASNGRLPLSRILQIVQARVPGEVLEVDLDDDDDDGPQYEIKILTPDDRVIEATVDARTGAILDLDEDD